MSQMEARLCEIIEQETGKNPTFKRLTHYAAKIKVTGYKEETLMKCVEMFSKETGIYFKTANSIYNDECFTVLFFEYPHKEQFYLAELERASKIIENYNNMFGEGSWNTDEDVEHFRELISEDH